MKVKQSLATSQREAPGQLAQNCSSWVFALPAPVEDRREWAVAHSPQRDDCCCDPLDSRECLGGVAEQSLGRFRSCCWFRVPAALRGDAAEQIFMCGSECQVVELQMERIGSAQWCRNDNPLFASVPAAIYSAPGRAAVIMWQSLAFAGDTG